MTANPWHLGHFIRSQVACIDIYQALVEERPYKNGLDHNQAIDILNNMASNGFVDETIVEDINHCFG